MSKEMKALAEVFAAKDQVEGFLADLEQLKAEGSITEQQHSTLKGEYDTRLNAALSEITRIKSAFKKQLEITQRDMETYKWELGKIEIKYKVGELPLDKYQSSDRKLRAEIEKLERYSDGLTLLIQANSAADIGAPAKKPRAAAPEPLPLSKAAPTVKASAPARRSKLPRGRLLAMVGGAVALIVVVVLAVVLFTPGEKKKAGLPPEQYETTEVTIPVDIQGATGVGSLYFELVYDAEVLRAVGVKNGTLLGDAMLEYSVDAPGRVIVGIIDSDGISRDGSVTIVTFQAQRDTGTTIALDLEEVVAHDTATMAEISATLSGGSLTVEDSSFTAPTIIFAAVSGQ